MAISRRIADLTSIWNFFDIALQAYVKATQPESFASSSIREKWQNLNLSSFCDEKWSKIKTFWCLLKIS